MSDYIRQNGYKTSYNIEETWTVSSDIEHQIALKIAKHGHPLKDKRYWNIRINFGIKTGFNDAFLIDEKTKNQLIKEDPKSAEIIRPILRGRDVQRYGYQFAHLWLIATFPSKQYSIDDYPAVKKHLLSFGIHKLEQTGKTYLIDGQTVKARKKTNNKWFETQDSIGYWDDFSKQKIVWKRIGSILRFCLDNNSCVTLDSTCLATGEDIPFLVAALNSLMGNYLLCNSPKTGTGDLIISVQAIEPLMMAMPTKEIYTSICNNLDNILELQKTGEDYSLFEKEIDRMMFDLYGLTEEERIFVTKKVIKEYRGK